MTYKFKKGIVIITISIIVITWLFWINAVKLSCYDMAQEMCNCNCWQKYITYSMLSDEIKEVISYSEFNDSDSLHRLTMYRKLEEVYFTKGNLFSGSTSQWKSPVYSVINDGDTEYIIEHKIDLDVGFWIVFPKVEVVNWTCKITERN